MEDEPGSTSGFETIEAALTATIARVCETFREGLPKWRIRRDEVAAAVRITRVNRDSEVIAGDSRVALFAQALVDELRRADKLLTPEQVASLERRVAEGLAAPPPAAAGVDE